MKKRVISIIRNIFDGVMIFVLFITTTVYALPSNGVIYDNSNSGSSATNVSEAIDDLYSKLTLKDAEINRLKGLGNVASNQMLKGYTALVQGNLITGTIPSKGAATYTPGTTNQTIASGNYLSGVQTIKGDANLVAGNIAKGKSIFGVTGTYTSDANATVADIAVGKTAYVNGNKITGTATITSPFAIYVLDGKYTSFTPFNLHQSANFTINNNTLICKKAKTYTLVIGGNGSNGAHTYYIRYTINGVSKDITTQNTPHVITETFNMSVGDTFSLEGKNDSATNLRFMAALY